MSRPVNTPRAPDDHPRSEAVVIEFLPVRTPERIRPAVADLNPRACQPDLAVARECLDEHLERIVVRPGMERDPAAVR
jgi:hypothetical protein